MNLDYQLLILINRGLATPWLDGVMLAFTLIGYPEFLALLPLPLLRRYQKESLSLILGIGLATLLAVGLQLLIQRPRPIDTRQLIPPPHYPSFPSGHATGAFADATLIAAFWPRARRPAYLIAGLIAFSRVYLGLHYPLDILGGALLGIAVGHFVLHFITPHLNFKDYFFGSRKPLKK